jgi:hypothetical protein
MVQKESKIVFEDTYPGTWVEIPADAEKSPFEIEKMELAIKILTEAPIPEWLLKQSERVAAEQVSK